MRNWSLLTAILIAGFVSPAVGQEGAAGTAATSQISIAVIDVGFILKNHPTMKNDLDTIEGQMKQADEEMTKRRNEILKLMEQLKERFQEGTAEYIKEEKRIAAMDTDFRLEIVNKRKEFDGKRAQVLSAIYSEITSLVAYASKSMGIQVVLRVNGTREKLDPNKPETVQLKLSQEVVHYASNVDLTEWVLDGLKQRSANRTGAAVPR